MVFQRLDQLAVVHRQFVGGHESVPNTLGQKGFDVPGGGGHGHRMALRGQPVGDGAQVGGIGAVHRDDQRLAGGDHVVGQAVEEPAVPQPQRLQADLQQPLLPRPAFAVRGQHPAAHPGRAPEGAAVHPHRQAGLRGAAGHRETDDAAPDDGQ